MRNIRSRKELVELKKILGVRESWHEPDDRHGAMFDFEAGIRELQRTAGEAEAQLPSLSEAILALTVPPEPLDLPDLLHHAGIDEWEVKDGVVLVEHCLDIGYVPDVANMSVNDIKNKLYMVRQAYTRKLLREVNDTVG